MAEISYDRLQTLLQNASGGAFFLHGDEELLREEAVSRVMDAHLDPATRDFNLDHLRGPDLTAEALASVLATPPMMAEWRVVVVREAQGLAQKAREVVESVLAAPPPGLALVLVALIPSGSQAKFYSVLRKKAQTVDFPRVEPIDAPGWLIERARTAHGLEMDPDAATAMVSALGTDLGHLTAELGKLASFVEDRRSIAVADVEALTGTVRRQDRWEWFDLVGDRRLDEALRTLPTLLEAGESGVGLVIGMTSQLLRVAIACAGGSAALERELKPYQRWLARRIVPQSRRWTLQEVDVALEELLRADRLLKSASLTDRQVMEELLLRLRAIQGGRSAAA